MNFRKPELLPTLFLLCSLGVLCSLGMWQLERLAWKKSVMAQAEVAKAAPVLAGFPQDMEGLAYRRVMLTGRFLHDKTLHLIGRQQGMEMAFYMVTPLVLDDDGRVVLVNRGFSPPGKESKPSGLVTVEGVLRPLREHRYFAPDNDPQKNIWSYEDADEIEAFVGKRPLPLVVEATGQAKPGEFPVPNDGTFVFRNDHLGYAVTWFGLALVSLVMFAAYYRRRD